MIYALISTNTLSANTYLIKNKQNILIDPGCHTLIKLKDFLTKQNIKFEDINYILLTHAHADHFINCKYFKNAKILASTKTKKYFILKKVIETASNFFENDYFPQNIVEVKDNDILTFNNYKIQVISSPGHTDDSVIFLDEENKILFSGDTFFKNNCGRYDLINSNKNQLIKSLQKIQKLNFNTLCAGHGTITKYPKQEYKKEIDNLINFLKIN